MENKKFQINTRKYISAFKLEIHKTFIVVDGEVDEEHITMQCLSNYLADLEIQDENETHYYGR